MVVSVWREVLQMKPPSLSLSSPSPYWPSRATQHCSDKHGGRTRMALDAAASVVAAAAVSFSSSSRLAAFAFVTFVFAGTGGGGGRGCHHYVFAHGAALDASEASALASSPSASTGADRHGAALIEWVRSKDGGYVNPNIEARLIFDDYDDYDDDDGVTDSDDATSVIDDADQNQEKGNHSHSHGQKKAAAKKKKKKTSNRGLFATGAMVKNETLMVIPQACLITSGDTYDMCDTAHNLLKEMKRGLQSDYAPYVIFLMEEKPGLIPSAWSQEGRALLRTIVGKELPPGKIVDASFRHECMTSRDKAEAELDHWHHADESIHNNDLHFASPQAEEAYMYVTTRSLTDVVVPLFDMMNHRNGRWTNADNTDAHYQTESNHDVPDSDESFDNGNGNPGSVVVYATRDISAGEQLYVSYNECTGGDCDGIAHTYLLQDMFRDYGFVEQYPRRWKFHAGPDVVFELDEIRPMETKKMTTTTTTKITTKTKTSTMMEKKVTATSKNSATWRGEDGISLTWISGKPELEQIVYLRGHLNRLINLKGFVEYNLENRLSSRHERRVASEFYDAMTSALKYAIYAAEDDGDAYISPDDDDDDGGEGDRGMGDATDKDTCHDEIDDDLVVVIGENGTASDSCRTRRRRANEPIEGKDDAKEMSNGDGDDGDDGGGGGKESGKNDDDDDDDDDDDNDDKDTRHSPTLEEKFDECSDLCRDEEDGESRKLCSTSCFAKYREISNDELLCNFFSSWNRLLRSNDYDRIYDLRSYYSHIEFQHSDKVDDTCLFLNGSVQACHSFRPHYHEVIVHHSARYVDHVRRVFFVGGGDSMLLHEVLKYPTLELVIGLELDQHVVRSSFKYLGTQPHWDDERVNWWYGDGAKSMMALPREYYGTFDLAIVDLQTDIRDVLMVTDRLTIVDAVVLLLRPEGILAWNEDNYLNFYDDGDGDNERDDYIDYTVDLTYHDVPVICHQSVAIGSKTVDFITQRPWDHNIQTLFLWPLNGDDNDPYRAWYNYRYGRTDPAISDKRKRRCLGVGDDGGGGQGGGKGDRENISLGVFMVIEVEGIDTTTMPLDSLPVLRGRIGGALEKLGLTEIFSMGSTTTAAAEAAGGTTTTTNLPNEVDPAETESTGGWREGEGKGKGAVAVFVLREGYVVARTWPEWKYCAFDVMMWRDLSGQDRIKSELIDAIGGGREKRGGGTRGRLADDRSSSSFRIVTGGMFGVGPEEDGRDDIGPPESEVCPGWQRRAVEDSRSDRSATNTDTAAADAAREMSALAKLRSAMDAAVVGGLSSMARGSGMAIVVLCGDASHECGGLEALMKLGDKFRVLPLWDCPGIFVEDGSATMTAEYEERTTMACRRDLIRSLRWFVNAAGGEGGSKITGIVIDPDAAGLMGQVLHQALSSARVRRELLADDGVIVLDVIPTVLSEPWRKHLLDSFRTEFFKFDPSYRAEVVFRDAASAATGAAIDSTTIAVDGGIDGDGTSLNMGIYSSGDPGFYSRLISAMGDIGRETGLVPELRSVRNGLKNYVPDFEPTQCFTLDHFDHAPSLEQWRSQHPLGQQVVIQFEAAEARSSSSSDSGQRGGGGEGGPYTGEAAPPPLLSADKIEGAVRAVLWSIDLTGGRGSDIGGIRGGGGAKGNGLVGGGGGADSLRVVTVGDGCVVTAHWSGGDVVVSWDGRNHVDVNLFTHSERTNAPRRFEDGIAAEIPSLAIMALDIYPRGIGRVVNFQKDIGPRWTVV